MGLNTFSGPNSAVIEPDDTPVAFISNFVEGMYVFQLTVTDAEASRDKDTVTVVVKQGIILAVNYPTCFCHILVAHGPSHNRFLALLWVIDLSLS